jgi:FdhD protein
VAGPTDRTRTYQARRHAEAAEERGDLELIGEEPLLIRIDDNPYLVVMRTPGEESYHAAGFCLGEGIVDSADDIERIGHDTESDPNLVDVWLRPERRPLVRHLLERRRFVSQTSCGICGKEMINDLHQILTPVRDDLVVPARVVHDCLELLSESQQYYQTTRGSHAALLIDPGLEVIAFAEDVGRHNALDKAIGKAFLEGQLERAKIVVLSSRVSYELIQKAARARMAMMVSHSRPTSFAAEMGRSLDMTLAFPDGDDLVVVCGAQRVSGLAD